MGQRERVCACVRALVLTRVCLFVLVHVCVCVCGGNVCVCVWGMCLERGVCLWPVCWRWNYRAAHFNGWIMKAEGG